MYRRCLTFPISITASYWDTSTSGQTTSAGGSGVGGKTTSQIQSVTTYTGIYASWNNNLDGVTGNDDPWTFGTKMQHPMLEYKKHEHRSAGRLGDGHPRQLERAHRGRARGRMPS